MLECTCVFVCVVGLRSLNFLNRNSPTSHCNGRPAILQVISRVFSRFTHLASTRWLSEKYPRIVRDIIEHKASEGPVDPNAPNPNNIEYDNLYLDMNGIIHNCTHPENGSEVVNLEEAEMKRKLFEHIDRLFSCIRPRNLLYLAVDGVAPRAKTNQQRMRR